MFFFDFEGVRVEKWPESDSDKVFQVYLICFKTF